MDYDCHRAGVVLHPAIHQSPSGCSVFRCDGNPVRHGCAGRQRGVLRSQPIVCGSRGRAVCGSSRSNLYRCAAMDSEEPVRSAQTMEQCSRKAHVTGRWTEFVPEQYYGSGAVYRDCEDVVEETWNRLSKLLIPLSYASGMGGVCTLIGTPPNLIISGLYAEETGIQMNVLATTIPGLFCLAVGVLSVIAMRRLLPDRQGVDDTHEDTTDYTVEMVVPSSCKYIGETLGYAGLINVNGGRLIKMHHFDGVAVPIDENEFIMGGDKLVFAGNIKEIMELTKTYGLVPGDEVIHVGFKTLRSALIMIAMVVLSATGVMPLLMSACLAALAMVITRCCTPNQAVKSIDWSILVVFAGSVVLGLAIQKTGIAERMATGILDICGTNPIVVMTAVCLVATFITEFISNTAAGAMFFPIMYHAAVQLGYEPMTFLIALMISVSSSFATPIGSPTHMMVYGPGGYRFTDFLRIGFWMNIIILAANIFITNLIYPLTPLG